MSPAGGPSGGGPHESLAPAEAERLDRAVRALPPADRRILILSRLHRLTHAEIAKRLTMDEDDVRRSLLRSLLAIARAPANGPR